MVLVLVAINITLFLGNRSLQVQMQEQQLIINEGIRVSRVNTQLIQAIATLSAQSDDADLRALLAAHGVTFKFNPNPDESSE